MRVVAWQPLLTDHQRHTLDALGEALGGGSHYIVGRIDDAERDAQGWARVDARLETLPPRGWLAWARARLRADRNAVHLFGSPFEDRRLIVVLALALLSGARVWLVSEPWSDSSHGYFSATPTRTDAAKARLRPLLYRAYGALLRGRVAGVFAISPLAVRQYRAIGVAGDRVLPFGYFVPAGAVPLPRRPSARLRLVFVGALIARKGVDDLVAAIDLLAARGVRVDADIYGPGTPGKLGRCRYRGRIPFGEAAAVIAGYDALVVPSRHDGWGVVVNEAIQSGVPVIASDRTGAGAMIDRWRCGVRFRAGDAAALADVLGRIAADASALPAMASAAAALAPALNPAVAATYMAAAIAGRPVPNPWFDT